jgi:hypothetical protein
MPISILKCIFCFSSVYIFLLYIITQNVCL